MPEDHADETDGDHDDRGQHGQDPTRQARSTATAGPVMMIVVVLLVGDVGVITHCNLLRHGRRGTELHVASATASSTNYLSWAEQIFLDDGRVRRRPLRSRVFQ